MNRPNVHLTTSGGEDLGRQPVYGMEWNTLGMVMVIRAETGQGPHEPTEFYLDMSAPNWRDMPRRYVNQSRNLYATIDPYPA